MSIELTSEEREVLRRWGKDPDRIAAACHRRPNWLRELMVEDSRPASVVSQRIPTGEEPVSGFIGTPSMQDIERLERRIAHLEEAVISMAVALGAALPMTPDVVRALSEVADTGGGSDV